MVAPVATVVQQQRRLTPQLRQQAVLVVPAARGRLPMLGDWLEIMLIQLLTHMRVV
jgi:hypothetical protein